MLFEDECDKPAQVFKPIRSTKLYLRTGTPANKKICATRTMSNPVSRTEKLFTPKPINAASTTLDAKTFAPN